MTARVDFEVRIEHTDRLVATFDSRHGAYVWIHGDETHEPHGQHYGDLRIDEVTTKRREVWSTAKDRPAVAVIALRRA